MYRGGKWKVIQYLSFILEKVQDHKNKNLQHKLISDYLPKS